MTGLGIRQVCVFFGTLITMGSFVTAVLTTLVFSVFYALYHLRDYLAEIEEADRAEIYKYKRNWTQTGTGRLRS